MNSSHCVISGNPSENSSNVFKTIGLICFSFEWHTVGNRWCIGCSPKVVNTEISGLWYQSVLDFVASNWQSLENKTEKKVTYKIQVVWEGAQEVLGKAGVTNISSSNSMNVQDVETYPKSGSVLVSSPSWKLVGWWWAALLERTTNV